MLGIKQQPLSGSRHLSTVPILTPSLYQGTDENKMALARGLKMHQPIFW